MVNKFPFNNGSKKLVKDNKENEINEYRRSLSYTLFFKSGWYLHRNWFYQIIRCYLIFPRNLAKPTRAAVAELPACLQQRASHHDHHHFQYFNLVKLSCNNFFVLISFYISS